MRELNEPGKHASTRRGGRQFKEFRTAPECLDVGEAWDVAVLVSNHQPVLRFRDHLRIGYLIFKEVLCLDEYQNICLRFKSGYYPLHSRKGNHSMHCS